MDKVGGNGLIKEVRSVDMKRGNKVTVIINSKDPSDAKELYKSITTALRKENRRRNYDISFEVLCVGKG